MTTLVRPRLGPPADDTPAAGAPARSRVARLALGREDAWVRPAMVGVTLLSALLYTWNLAINGFANTYYSAAALAASQSWSAWFFGSFDASSFITVDKPPLSTMVMGLSVRLFGLSSWSILLPEAAMGVATVVLLFLAVRRSFGAPAAVLAALVMALTPVAALMFRFNNPDALLTLLVVGSAYALIRAMEDGRFRWALLAAVLIGFGFLTKYLQAFLVVPGFALTYAVAARAGWRRRLVVLVASAVTLLIASGWWVVAVDAIPAALRPYIGGSTNNTALDLVFGYDGLGRIFGATGPGGGGGGGGAGFGGATGLLRMFNSEFGGQIAWLLPFAGIALVSGLWIHRRAQRTDRQLAGYLLWGSWLAVHTLVFSLMSGTIHSYYAVAMAPAVAALTGAGMVELWHHRRSSFVWGLALAAGILATAWTASQLLARSPDFLPGLDVAILALGASAALIVAIPVAFERRKVALAALAVGLVAMLAAPVAWSLETVASAHEGSLVSAGPATSGDGFGRGGFGGQPGIGIGGPGGGTAGGPGFGSGGGTFAPPAGAGSPATGGGPGDAGVDQALIDYLVANRGTARWIVAASGSGSAGNIELTTGLPVMAMGGFTGSDPAPTLDELKALIASGDLRYVLAGGSGGRGGPGGPGGGNDSVTSWVQSACSAVTIDRSTASLYDCAGAIASGG